MHNCIDYVRLVTVEKNVYITKRERKRVKLILMSTWMIIIVLTGTIRF